MLEKHTTPARRAGVVLLLLNLVLNEWVLTAVFSPDGVIMPVKLYLISVFNVACLTVAAVLLAGRARRVRAGRAVTLGLFVLLASVVILEGGLRLYFSLRSRMFRQGRAVSEMFGWRPNPNYRVTRAMPGYGMVSYSTTNEGFRVWGDPDTSRLKTLVLGDSTTEAAQVSDGATYYEQLKAICPDIEVFAFGAGGYGSLQEFMILDAYWDVIRPGLVIWQFDGNDIMNNSLDLESVSPANIRMMRPYLINGRVQLRYPARHRSRILRAIESSHLVRLLGVMPNILGRRHQVHDGVDELPDHAESYAAACAATREIMGMVKARIGDTPLVAFCVYEGEGRSSGRVYEDICRDLGFLYMRGLDEAVAEAKTVGQVITGIENGREIDSHLNERGHAMLGRLLGDFLATNKLAGCEMGGRNL